MKNLFGKMLLVAGVAGAVVAAPAHAATGTGDATVKVLGALAVTKTSDLNFGRVVASATAGTVSVGEDNSRVCAVGLTCFGTTTAGAFSVSGTAGETVTVAITNPSITLSNGSQTMAVALSTTTTSLSLTGGSGSFKVAGALTVGANQAPGNYSGQYSVAVDYQ